MWFQASLQRNDNDLFYRIRFIVFMVCLLFFGLLFFVVVVLCFRLNTKRKWLCQTYVPVNTYPRKWKTRNGIVQSFLSPCMFISLDYFVLHILKVIKEYNINDFLHTNSCSILSDGDCGKINPHHIRKLSVSLVIFFSVSFFIHL